jgi:hypothetical protein
LVSELVVAEDVVEFVVAGQVPCVPEAAQAYEQLYVVCVRGLVPVSVFEGQVRPLPAKLPAELQVAWLE